MVGISDKNSDYYILTKCVKTREIKLIAAKLKESQQSSDQNIVLGPEMMFFALLLLAQNSVISETFAKLSEKLKPNIK